MSRRPRTARNVVPDRLDLRDRPYEPAVTHAPPPLLNSLTGGPLPLRLTPLDQGETSACTGFALARVIDYLLVRAGRFAEAPVSPFMLYSMARRYDEFPGFTADEGSSLRGALKGWYKHGACSSPLWPALRMPKPAADPSEDWWPDAVRRPLGAYYRVDTRSVTDMHVALSEVGILYASAICHAGWDEGFDGPRRTQGWAIPHRKALPSDGGHAFAIVGYDQRCFLVLNSWGKAWGTAGLGILTYVDWLDHAMDCWVAQLGVTTDQHLEVSRAVTLRIGATKQVSLATEPNLRNREISPFIIDVENNGELGDQGAFRTQRSDLDALVTIHLDAARQRWGLTPGAPIDLAVYAHGGLTSETAAAETASRWIPALYEAQVLPVFLMWETDLWSTLKNRLGDLVSGFTSQAERPTSGMRDQVQRFWNRRVERTLSPPGSLIWDEMKQNAEAIATSPRSGLRLVYKAGVAHGTLQPGKVRLHLIGHSAGAIVLSHAAKALIDDGWDIATISFLAPAVRRDVFDRTVKPHLGTKVASYHQYHLRDAAEQRDATCRPILLYGRSLLYLVSESFEQGVETPILGMEKFFGPYRGSAVVHENLSPGSRASASTHGGFDEDELTMRSVITGIVQSRKVEGAGRAVAAERAGRPGSRGRS